MYIRCGACGASTRVPFGDTINSGVNCGSCGKRNSTAKAGALGSTPHQRYQRAECYSMQHKIDLASAYSVLLDILPLEKALSLDEAHPAEDRSEAQATPPATSSTPLNPQHYDPAFAETVAAGFLTVRQAAERGDRVLYASRLVRRHGLTMDLAFLVADNRLTLDEALKRHVLSANCPALVDREQDRPVASKAAIAFAAIAFVAIGGGIVWHVVAGGEPDGGAGSTSAAHASGSVVRTIPIVPRAATEVRLDANGRPVVVKAPNPESVLSAYCGSSTQPVIRVPEKIARAGDDYVGYYTESGIRYAIRIRKEPGGFVAGTVSEPIQPEELKARAHG